MYWLSLYFDQGNSRWQTHFNTIQTQNNKAANNILSNSLSVLRMLLVLNFLQCRRWYLLGT